MFEGIRCYETARGPAIFRLEEHIDRLMLLGEDLPHGDPVSHATRSGDACIEIVVDERARRRATSGRSSIAATRTSASIRSAPVEVAVAAFPWGKYLGEDALTKGVAVKVSSWQRMAPNTMPAMAKAVGATT